MNFTSGIRSKAKKLELSQFHKIIIFPFHIIAMLHQKVESFLRPFVSFAGEAIRIGGGLMLLFISLALSMSLVAALFVFLGWGPGEAIHLKGVSPEIIVNSFPTNFWMIVSTFITFFVPAFLVGLFGVMMLRKQIIWNTTLGWTLMAFWFFNAIGTGVSIGMIARDFTIRDTYTQTQEFDVELSDEVIVLDLENIGEYDKPRLSLEGHEDEDILLVKDYQSRGKNHQNAIQNAQMITYEVNQNDNTLIFPKRVDFLDGAKYRFQELRLTLQLPYDQAFKITKRFGKHFRRHFRGYQESDILKYTREAGLICTTCPEEDERHAHYHDHDWEEHLEEAIEHEIEEAIEEGIEEAVESLFEEEYREGYKNFDRIAASGAIKLKISQGSGYKVNLVGNEASKKAIKIEQHGDQLKISTKNWKGHSNLNITVEITMPSIRELELSGACTALAKGFKENNIEIEINGASNLDLEGQTQSLDIELSGASFLNASRLKARKVDIEASGASKIKVWADNTLHVEASGASHIQYGGNPKNVNFSNSGMSTISKL